MFPDVSKVLKKMKKKKFILWDESRTLKNGVFEAKFRKPKKILKFYEKNMEFFNENRVNTKCIEDVLLIYVKKPKKKEKGKK